MPATMIVNMINYVTPEVQVIEILSESVLASSFEDFIVNEELEW